MNAVLELARRIEQRNTISGFRVAPLKAKQESSCTLLAGGDYLNRLWCRSLFIQQQWVGDRCIHESGYPFRGINQSSDMRQGNGS